MPIKVIRKRVDRDPYPSQKVYPMATPKDQERDQAVQTAIDFIKTCAYKGTAIKIELEAHLGRQGGSTYCRMCNGTGESECSDCSGNGVNCDNCTSIGIVRCSGCNGQGRLRPPMRPVDVEWCDQFIMSYVSPAARRALVFHKTYNDGSVDTEFTFTLPIDLARYAVEFIEAFNAIAQELNCELGVHGAGMHIAILNSSDCKYPAGNMLDTRRAENFKASMTHLLPALFFLASSDHRSRRLGFRQPRISLRDKYSAINGGMGCFEYRVFETCYQRPMAIFDNLCIIANTLKYYHYRKITHTFFGKIGKFGFSDYGSGIERFYKTETNYRALMAGVSKLKPSYKSMADLRKERNFKVTLDRIKRKEQVQESIWRGEYITIKKNAEDKIPMLERRAEREWRAYKENTTSPRQKKKVFIEKFIELNSSNILKESEKQFINKKKRQAESNVYAVVEI